MTLEVVLDVVPIVVAVVALATSFYTFRLTGSFVRVRVAPDMVMYGSDGKPQPVRYVSVTAYNVGRTEVAVSMVGFISGRRPGRSVGFITPIRPLGPELPCTLRAGHSQSWMADQDDLLKKITKRPIRAYVTLGSDRTRKSRSFSLESDKLTFRSRLERKMRRWFF